MVIAMHSNCPPLLLPQKSFLPEMRIRLIQHQLGVLTIRDDAYHWLNPISVQQIFHSLPLDRVHGRTGVIKAN